MTAAASRSDDRRFAVALARAFGGAIIFSLPMLMTMEMWTLGSSLDPLRLALFVVGMIPLLIGLSHFGGFEPTFDWMDDTVDAFVALAVGFATSVAVLALFDEIGPEMSRGEVVGKMALQAVPGSIGALLARGQLGQRDPHAERELTHAGYWGELFLWASARSFWRSTWRRPRRWSFSPTR